MNSSLTSNHVALFSLFEGAYTRVNAQSQLSGDLQWWVAPKTSDLADDSDAGAYRNSILPGSGAGTYGEGSDLADE